MKQMNLKNRVYLMGMMRFLILMALQCFASTKASAHDIEMANTDGVTIYYVFTNDNTELEVSYRGESETSYSDEYQGNVKIPESVTYNGNSYPVTSIGDWAFYSCSELTSVTVPNSISRIGECAFDSCSSLTSVSIGNSVTEICEGAFRCSGLTSIVIPNSVTRLGYFSFEHCSDLTSVTLSNSLEIIEEHTFEYCSSLTNVTIPNSVTRIREYAFNGCGLISVVIPNSVTSIYEFAFAGCYLTSVTIPNSVTSIGERAFEFNPLTSVSIGNSVTSIGSRAFESRSELTSITVASGNTKYDSRNDCNAIIETASNTLITGCMNTIIPNSVTGIGDYAFFHSSGLTSIEIPNSVTSIGSEAFFECSDLTSIEIPNSVTSIGDGAFIGCSGLTSLTIPNSVTSIGDGAFSYCSGLISVTIHCNEIKEWFMGLANIKEIALGDEVKSIVDQAFSGCAGLTSIVVDLDNTFFDSREGSNAIIKTGNNELIAGCKNTIIPNSVTSIGNGAFSGCSGLTSITIPNSVTGIGNNAFYYCKGLTSITIPNSVTSIGDGAFSNCSGLTSITIPNSVTSIGNGAFWGCSGLTSITIPKSVTSISYSAFANCSGLTSVSVLLETPIAIYQNTFTNRADVSLYVPFGCKDAYAAADYWKDFKEIVEMSAPSPSIEFADANVKALCVANWDTNDDGELSEAEAAAVTDLGDVFKGSNDIVSFTELAYFTGLNSINDEAFWKCKNLAGIVIPDNVKKIGRWAFLDCYKLPTLSLSATVTEIGWAAFSGCYGLTTIAVADENPTFDSRDNCNAIIETTTNKLIRGCKNTVIPASVTTIEGNAFEGCETLKTITIPESVTSIGDCAFAGCKLLEVANIPTSVTVIGGSLFRYCEKLVTIIIPEGVTKIGMFAFDECYSLSSVTLPSTLETIETCAFSFCSNLTSVTVGMKTPITLSGGGDFSNHENATLYVPAGSKALYEVADNWKDFKEIVEMESESNNTLVAQDTEAHVGTKVVLPIELTNKDEVKLCQFDLQLPEGVTVATKSNGKLDATLTERAETHSISSKQLDNGDYRFIIASLDNDSFTGNSGTLVEITLYIPVAMEAGEYTIKVLNVELSVPDGNDLKVVKPADTESKLTVKSYTPGDVNNDGSVSVTDVGCAINYILEQVPSVFVFEAADMNGDKSISVTDVGIIINMILNEGAASRMNSQGRNGFNIIPSLMPTEDGYQLTVDGKENLVGFQFDVKPGDGTGWHGACPYVELAGGENDHLLTCRRMDDESYRVVCYSLTNSNFADDDAPLVKILTSGDVTISDVRLTTTDFEELRPTDLVGMTTGIANATSLSTQVSEHKVYTLDGRLCRIVRVQPGENPLKDLKAGIYMVDNHKVVVR